MNRRDTLLKLVFPKSLEEQVTDHVLRHPEWVERFITYPVDGHGAPQRIGSPEEQVRGRAARVAMEILIHQDGAADMISHLRADLSGADVSYWLTPVAAAGSFA